MPPAISTTSSPERQDADEGVGGQQVEQVLHGQKLLVGEAEPSAEHQDDREQPELVAAPEPLKREGSALKLSGIDRLSQFLLGGLPGRRHPASAGPAASPARDGCDRAPRGSRRRSAGPRRRHRRAARMMLVDAVLGGDVDAHGRAVEDQQRGLVAIHLASTTRCWLPPDSVFTGVVRVGHLDRRARAIHCATWPCRVRVGDQAKPAGEARRAP